MLDEYRHVQGVPPRADRELESAKDEVGFGLKENMEDGCRGKGHGHVYGE